MNTKVKQVSRTLIKIGIICVALNDSGTGATTPALGSIAAAMPLVSAALIQMIATAPTIFQAIFSLVYGKGVDLFKKKSWLVFGFLAFIIGGIAPAFFHSGIWVILAFRALLGVGVGVLIPMATDFVVDFFEGNERNSMMGFISAFMAFSGILFQLLGGWLAGIRWDYTFYAYAISIVFFLIAFFLLPEPDRASKVKAEAESKVNTKLTLGAVVHAVIFFFFGLFWFIGPTNGAIVLLGGGLATPAQIGLAFSIMSVASFVISLIYGPIFKGLRFILLPVTYISGAIGAYLCYSAQSFFMFILGLLFLGIALGFGWPITMGKATQLVSYTAASKAIGLVSFFFAIGGFLEPIIFNLFTAPGRAPFLVGAIGFVVVAVVVIIADRAFPTPRTAAESEKPQA